MGGMSLGYWDQVQAAGFEVPSDRAVPLGVNRGQPPVIAEAGSDFARAIREVSKSLLAPGAPKKRRMFAALARA